MSSPLPPTNRDLGLPCTPLSDGGHLKTLSKRLRTSDAAQILPESMPHVYQGPLHTTSLRQLQRCERFFYLKNRMGLKRKGEYNSAFKVGELVHQYIHYIMTGHTDVEALNELELEYLQWVSRTEPTANSLGVMPDGSTAEEFFRRADQDFRKAVAIARAFLRYCDLRPETYEVVEVEKVIYFQYKRSAPLSIRVDLLLRDRESGGLWIWDYKTTSSLPAELLASLTFDMQPSIYRLGLMADRPDDHVCGVVHAIIQKPSIRYSPDGLDKVTVAGVYPSDIQKKIENGGTFTELQAKRKAAIDRAVKDDSKYRGDSFAKYLDRVSLWYRELILAADAAPTDPLVQEARPLILSKVRFLRPIPPKDILGLIAKGTQARGRRATLDNFPRCCDMYTCKPPGNQKPCEFLGLCRMDHRRTVLPALIEAQFIQEHREEEERESDL